MLKQDIQDWDVCRYKGCYKESSYDSVACTTLEQSCFACYCSIAVEEFTGFSYCRHYWVKYLIQVQPTECPEPAWLMTFNLCRTVQEHGWNLLA